MIGLALALLAVQMPTALPLPVQTPLRVTVPAGTPIHFTTVVALNSRTARQGQRFELRVADDVRIASALVIPKGTPAVGEVEAVSTKGMVGKAGKLVLQPLFIELSEQRIYLTGIAVEQGADATTGVAVGSLLLTSLGMFITGKSASLPAGARMDGRIRTEANVAVPPVPAATAR